MFSKPSIKELLSRYTLVQLYTDRVPPQYEPTTSAEENRALQNEKFGSAQLPLYVIVKPLGEGKFVEVDRYVEGKINNIAAFADFLRRHLPVQITRAKAFHREPPSPRRSRSRARAHSFLTPSTVRSIRLPPAESSGPPNGVRRALRDNPPVVGPGHRPTGPPVPGERLGGWESWMERHQALVEDPRRLIQQSTETA